MLVRMPTHSSALEADASRLSKQATKELDAAQRVELGQFFTPSDIATFMASMPAMEGETFRILDPGAGTGMLSAAVIARLCVARRRPRSISLTVYEVDAMLRPALRATVARCAQDCASVGVAFSADIRTEDFIEGAVRAIVEIGPSAVAQYDLAILNPPYRKLRADSWHRALLREVGVETSNLYTAFLSLALRLTKPGGEMVAITPRSFCNGTYFRGFRGDLLSRFRFRRIHVFERRDDAFREDSVLQENIIFCGVRTTESVATVVVSSSNGEGVSHSTERIVRTSEVVRSDDREAFIRIVPEEAGDELASRVSALPAMLSDLGLTVSTGRVVDFRARQWLRMEAGPADAPLIYPHHMTGGFVEWPRVHAKKPNAIAVTVGSQSLLVPGGVYVLVKRFSAKEEPRRIMAAVYDARRARSPLVGIENHLNYFHINGGGLPLELAKGLAVYLNSTAFDTYFRQFSGHTQVNATDLRNVAYPSRDTLLEFGRQIGDRVADQQAVDELLDDALAALNAPVHA
ncbi:Eco57I restriction-modification methylase domain-containing protein [soil metagenome]